MLISARECIHEMHGVKRTAMDGFLGPLCIHQPSGSADGILSSYLL